VSITGFTLTGNSSLVWEGSLKIVSSGNKVVGNTFSDNKYGVFIDSQGKDDNLISDNSFLDNEYGVFVYFDSNHTTISDNLFQGNEYGINLHSSDHNSVTRNICTGNTHGIYLDLVSEHNLVSGNTCSLNENGIYVYISSHNALVNNTCSHNTRNGIIFNNYAYDNTLNGNTISDNDVGITFHFNSRNNTLRYNSIVNNAAGVDASGNEGKVIDAAYNYWGDTSGPYHSDRNPEGTGDSISDDVDFRPWIQEFQAFIDSISPNPARPGEIVYFNGSGIEPFDTIVGYEWRSSIDGHLSSEQSFNSSSLSEGKHIIYFRIRNSKGSWSKEAQGSLLVGETDDPSPSLLSSPLVLGILMVVCSAGVLVILYVLFTETGLYMLGSFLLPLYSRLKKEEIMNQEVRGRIYQVIVSNPGIHLRGILKEYRKANRPSLHISGLVYHLDVLGRNRMIRSVTDGYRKLFYIRGHPVEKTLPELILDKITEYFRNHRKGITGRELAESFNVSEKIVRTNLKKISKDVTAERDGRFLRYRPLSE